MLEFKKQYKHSSPLKHCPAMKLAAWHTKYLCRHEMQQCDLSSVICTGTPGNSQLPKIPLGDWVWSIRVIAGGTLQRSYVRISMKPFLSRGNWEHTLEKIKVWLQPKFFIGANQRATNILFNSSKHNKPRAKVTNTTPLLSLL